MASFLPSAMSLLVENVSMDTIANTSTTTLMDATGKAILGEMGYSLLKGSAQYLAPSFLPGAPNSNTSQSTQDQNDLNTSISSSIHANSVEKDTNSVEKDTNSVGQEVDNDSYFTKGVNFINNVNNYATPIVHKQLDSLNLYKHAKLAPSSKYVTNAEIENTTLNPTLLRQYQNSIYNIDAKDLMSISYDAIMQPKQAFLKVSSTVLNVENNLNLRRPKHIGLDDTRQKYNPLSLANQIKSAKPSKFSQSRLYRSTITHHQQTEVFPLNTLASYTTITDESGNQIRAKPAVIPSSNKENRYFTRKSKDNVDTSNTSMTDNNLPLIKPPIKAIIKRISQKRKSYESDRNCLELLNDGQTVLSPIKRAHNSALNSSIFISEDNSAPDIDDYFSQSAQIDGISEAVSSIPAQNTMLHPDIVIDINDDKPKHNFCPNDDTKFSENCQKQPKPLHIHNTSSSYFTSFTNYLWGGDIHSTQAENYNISNCSTDSAQPATHQHDQHDASTHAPGTESYLSSSINVLHQSMVLLKSFASQNDSTLVLEEQRKEAQIKLRQKQQIFRTLLELIGKIYEDNHQFIKDNNLELEYKEYAAKQKPIVSNNSTSNLDIINTSRTTSMIGSINVSSLTDDDVRDYNEQLQKITDDIHNATFLTSIENTQDIHLRNNYNKIVYMNDLSNVILYWMCQNLPEIAVKLKL